MKLIYLSEANLRDRLLVRDLVFKYKSQEKAIVLHEPFGGTVRDTRFVTKRLSSLFSEAMVYNNYFTVDQRGICKRDESGKLIFNKERVEQVLAPIQMIVLGPVIKENGEDKLLDGEELLNVVRDSMDFSELLLFPINPLSPIGNKKVMVEGEKEYNDLFSLFEEEKETLDRALRLRPARIVAPNYLQRDS
ncbi:MAG: hypothetical protein AAFY71_07295 [Bacteroidota bacterium]